MRRIHVLLVLASPPRRCGLWIGVEERPRRRRKFRRGKRQRGLDDSGHQLSGERQRPYRLRVAKGELLHELGGARGHLLPDVYQ